MEYTKNIVITLIVFMVLLFPVYSLAQEQTNNAARRQARDFFSQKYDHRWQIRWNHTTDTPASLRGHRISKYSGAPLSIARDFIRDEKVMFGIEDVQNDLHLTKTNTSAMGGTRFIFEQVYNGVPVLASGYLIAVDNSSGIYFISGDYYPDIIVGTTPTLSPEDIRIIVESDMVQNITEPVLYIKAEVTDNSEKYVLIYQADATTSEPLDEWRYTVDANSGEILRKRSLIEKVNGIGRVYQTNPNNGDILTRTIRRLRNISPRKLDGDNVIVLNDEAYEASSSIGKFFYSSTNTHFDEVMAYYHSDEFEAWLIGKGMESERVGKVTIHTHNASYYAGSASLNRIIYFSDGTDFSGLKNPTKEASIIVHEYMHVVSKTYNNLEQNNEADAMDESYSDYFGLAYKNQFVNSSITGEYIDELGGLNYSRNLVNSYTYNQFGQIDLEPNSVYDKYDNCVIFSGALWDFRRDSDVNSSASDKIVLESLKYLDNNPSFLDGEDALITAANALSYSNYDDDILDAFFAHGIGDCPGNPVAPTNLTVSGYLGGIPTISWTASTSPNIDHYELWWREMDGNPPQGWQLLATTSNTSWHDSRVTIAGFGQVEDTYRYKALAVDQAGLESCFSNEDEVDVIESPPWYSKELAGELDAIPNGYALKENYPNPFNPTTTIRYALPEDSFTEFKIYNLMGREIRMLTSGNEQAGFKEIIWDGRDSFGRVVSSGVYIYQFNAKSVESDKEFHHTRKMILLR